VIFLLTLESGRVLKDFYSPNVVRIRVKSDFSLLLKSREWSVYNFIALAKNTSIYWNLSEKERSLLIFIFEIDEISSIRFEKGFLTIKISDYPLWNYILKEVEDILELEFIKIKV